MYFDRRRDSITLPQETNRQQNSKSWKYEDELREDTIVYKVLSADIVSMRQ